LLDHRVSAFPPARGVQRQFHASRSAENRAGLGHVYLVTGKAVFKRGCQIQDELHLPASPQPGVTPEPGNYCPSRFTPLRVRRTAGALVH